MIDEAEVSMAKSNLHGRGVRFGECRHTRQLEGCFPRRNLQCWRSLAGIEGNVAGWRLRAASRGRNPRDKPRGFSFGRFEAIMTPLRSLHDGSLRQPQGDDARVA